MNLQAFLKRDSVQASLVLAVILNAIFFPAIWRGETLLHSAWDVSSVMPAGAFHPGPSPLHFATTPDPGAPAWQTEPVLKIISDQYLNEHRLPLWNPYSAYGTPLTAAMLPQPFYPLTALISLHPTAWSYDILVIGRLFLAGLLMFFFARLFLDLMASLFAAIAFMLNGYFILYLRMPHMSVEILLPAVFLAFELLLRKNSWPAVAATSVVIFLCVTGGMPESLFLIVSFGTIYFIYRLRYSAEFGERRLERIAKFGVALFLGFALSGFLLLPFLEFMHNAHDTHQAVNVHGNMPGLAADYDWRNTFTYLLPSIFGPVLNSILGGGWNGMRGYWGIVPVLFAVAAVMGLSSKSHSATGTLKSLTIFFFAFLVLMILKRFGNPLINWIGRLPVAELIVFVKYQEPLMAFCVAILAGIGFSLFLKARIGFAYFFAAALVVLALLLGLAGWSWPHVLEHKETAYIFDLSLIAGVVVILAALLLIGISTRYPRAAWLPWAFVGMLSFELCFNYIYPNFYRYNELPSAESYNPYAGAPYVDFLRQRNTEWYRVFGRDGILYPDWSGVFKLMDVRDLDGMYYRRYIKFVRNFFLRSGDETRISGELADRFTGVGDGYSYDFVTGLERRFLTLSSVRYVLSIREIGVDTSVVNKVIDQHRAENLWGFGLENFLIAGGETASGVFQHPPSHRLSFKTVIDATEPVLEGVAAIKTEAQEKTDGVGFLLEIKSADNIEPLFSTLLNPRDVAQDRAGRPFRIDLSRYAGQHVELLFSTDPGPSGNNAYDWAGWAKLRFVPTDSKSSGASPFKDIYDNEVRIYEFSQTLPRASLFYSAEIMPDEEVLDRLKDPTFNPEQRIILSAESLPEGGDAILKTFAATAPARNAGARIVSYDSEHVQIETQSDAPAILMLNDANYPGWRASVNGNLASILQADYLFRGVIIPAGRATVDFVYAPASFRLGASISAASLVVLIVLIFSGGIWRRDPTTVQRREGGV
jgi:membrane protein YfhO